VAVDNHGGDVLTGKTGFSQFLSPDRLAETTQKTKHPASLAAQVIAPKNGNARTGYGAHKMLIPIADTDKMVIPEGLEPPTYRLGIYFSINTYRLKIN